MLKVQEINKETLSIEATINDIPSSYYEEMSHRIDELNMKGDFLGDEVKYQKTKLLIANYVYFIHEKVEWRVTREINYDLVRKWGAKNINLASFLLHKQFPTFKLQGFQKWVQPAIPLMGMGMYDRSTSDTKDTFH